MIDLKQAEEIMKDVRGDFRTGAKSGNKAYTDANGSHFAVIPPNIKAATKKSMPNKIARRMNNAKFAVSQVANIRQDGNARKDLTAIQYGKMVVFQAKVSGNCTEMACAAAYKVAEIDKGDIWIVETDGPGDHVFCALGRANEWNSNDTLSEVMDTEPKVIIIDPWANICCLAPDYLEAFGLKMGKWVGLGKRIATGGSSWTAPGQDYIDGFENSTPNVINARNSCPTLG